LGIREKGWIVYVRYDNGETERMHSSFLSPMEYDTIQLPEVLQAQPWYLHKEKDKAIYCNVWNEDSECSTQEYILSYLGVFSFYYLDIEGRWWDHADPIEYEYDKEFEFCPHCGYAIN
jgi:hypothetical protein